MKTLETTIVSTLAVRGIKPGEYWIVNQTRTSKVGPCIKGRHSIVTHFADGNHAYHTARPGDKARRVDVILEPSQLEAVA